MSQTALRISAQHEQHHACQEQEAEQVEAEDEQRHRGQT